MSAKKKSDRFPRIGGSQLAYETSNKDSFTSGIQISFNYSKLLKTEKQLQNELISFMTSFDSKTVKLINKRSAITQAKYNFNLIPDGITLQRTLEPAMIAIGQDGKDVMSNYIDRVQTGRMKSSVRYQTRKRNNNTKFVINIGWTELWYKYFGFQEDGTKHIKPMHSVMHTYLTILPKVNNYVLRFMMSYKAGSNNNKVDY